MDRILQKLPFQAPVFIPLVHLSKFLAHEQKLFPRMACHKAVSGPQVCKFLFLGISRHLSRHGAFSVDHLVMGEHQDEVLAVCVEHTEGQLSVVLVPEIGIALHISQEIVHPAHIPLIIKAQAAFLHISRDLGPGRGFLCNEDRSLCLFMEYRIQML